MPPAIPMAGGGEQSPGREVAMQDFLKLTRFPIQIVWGDYIPSEIDPANVGPLATLDFRRRNVLKAKLMVEAINRHGGDAQNLVLPEIGINGNAHFPMLETNNVQIADLMSDFLATKGLDRH